MKTKMSLLSALFLGALCVGQSADKTIAISPGDRIEIIAASSATQKLGPSTLKDIVKAMDILARYAPEEYTSLSGFITGTGSMFYSSPSRQKTKADEMRDEARSLQGQADAKKAEAAKYEKEIEEVKWAKSVLSELKRRLE